MRSTQTRQGACRPRREDRCRRRLGGRKNGALLQLAADLFDVLLTVDRKLEYQQNFAGLKLAVIVLHTPSNDVTALRPLMPAALAAIGKAKPERSRISGDVDETLE